MGPKNLDFSQFPSGAAKAVSGTTLSELPSYTYTMPSCQRFPRQAEKKCVTVGEALPSSLTFRLSGNSLDPSQKEKLLFYMKNKFRS